MIDGVPARGRAGVIVIATVSRLAVDHPLDLGPGQRLVFQQDLRQPLEIVAPLGQDALAVS